MVEHCPVVEPGEGCELSSGVSTTNASMTRNVEYWSPLGSHTWAASWTANQRERDTGSYDPSSFVAGYGHLQHPVNLGSHTCKGTASPGDPPVPLSLEAF